MRKSAEKNYILKNQLYLHIEKNSTFSIFGFMIDREILDNGGKTMDLDKILDKLPKK